MMLKGLLIIILTFVHVNSFSQTRDTLKKQQGVISFITKLNISNATKDGIYLNGYVVHMDYAQAKKLDAKTISVTGKVTIVKGLKNSPKEYNRDGEEIIKQGRVEDTKHILHPTIRIIHS